MRTCDLFDKYRDGELDAERRAEFETHLANCDDCRTRRAVLDNVVYLLRSQEVRPIDIGERIAHRAFERTKAWDAEIISWLRPGPAMAAVTLMLILVSSLWVISSNRHTASPLYDRLMNEADSVKLSSRISQFRNDSRLVTWVEQEGNSQ